MLTIRLFRVGKKKQPFFRIVVTDKTKPIRGGRSLEFVGFYNPLTKEKKLNAERIKYWLSVGAKPSDTIHNLLIEEKITEGKKIDVHKEKKTKGEKKEETKKEEKKEEKPVTPPTEEKKE